MEATASKLEIDAVVLASAGDEPQLKRILCVSTNGWIKRYRSDPASASVELTVEWAETTMRLAEMIDRWQVGLAGNSPPPVPLTADGGHDDAGTVDVKIAHEKAAFMAAFECAGLRTLMVTLLTREKVCSREKSPRTRHAHTRLENLKCVNSPPSPLPN
jgi:hypothetical protein